MTNEQLYDNDDNRRIANRILRPITELIEAYNEQLLYLKEVSKCH